MKAPTARGSKKIPPSAETMAPAEGAVPIKFDEKMLRNLENIFKSLADVSRLKILMTLAQEGELHVSAICERLGQSQPAVSHHLTQLKNAKLVDYTRTGKFNFYKLDAEMLSGLIDQFFPGAANGMQKVNYGELELSFKKN